MKIEGCELHFLKIPLRMSVTHGARAGRTVSDSVIVAIASGGRTGYGEAVMRDYVSGSLGEGAEFQSAASLLVARFVAPLEGRFSSWASLKSYLSAISCDNQELPFLCALETALMDLACHWEKKDLYSLLGPAPRRDVISYGAIMAIVQLREAEKHLRMCAELGFPNIKIKVNGDPLHTASILKLARGILGERFDIRVDANSSWPVSDAAKLFQVCRRYGVNLVEQPFDDSAAAVEDAIREARKQGFAIMADEGVLSLQDLKALAKAGTYSVVNLRLSKNGGLSRVLDLAAEARKLGLAYQLGCMVGETGILSALGRAAAALLPEPLYVEGSYDDVLLTENITTKSLGFGLKGEAPVIRGQGLGYEVSPEKLARLSVARVPCL